jgi:hypothetical protein
VLQAPSSPCEQFQVTLPKRHLVYAGDIQHMSPACLCLEATHHTHKAQPTQQDQSDVHALNASCACGIAYHTEYTEEKVASDIAARDGRHPSRPEPLHWYLRLDTKLSGSSAGLFKQYRYLTARFLVPYARRPFGTQVRSGGACCYKAMMLLQMNEPPF